MKPRPTLAQKIKPAEYLYAWGYASLDAACDSADNMIADCEVSRCERPRVIGYTNEAGARRWAVALTDTALEEFVR